jgi:hypothetical protein
MRKHLQLLQDNIQKRQAAFAKYKATSDELDKTDAMALMGLKAAGGTSPRVAGYLGVASKAASALSGVHGALQKVAAMHCQTLEKVVTGVATELSINMRDRSDDNPTTHGGYDTTGPGSRDAGLKACADSLGKYYGGGATAEQQIRLAKGLPNLNGAGTASVIRAALGQVNKNSHADPFGFNDGKGVPVPSIDGE